MVPKINIDGKEYKIEDLPKEAVDLINTILYINHKITELQNEIKILIAAKVYYSQTLKKILQSVEEK